MLATLAALALALGAVGQGLGAQAQAGQRRAQVVRDGGHEAVAVLQLAADARLHLVEDAAGLAAFARAVLGQRRAVDEVAPEKWSS